MFLDSDKTEGCCAISSVLLHFRGYAIHDCHAKRDGAKCAHWASYFKFDACRPILCNSHLFRELQATIERGFEWAQSIKQLKQ